MSSVLDIAAGEIGTKESPAGSNKVKYNTWYYGKIVQGADYKWCMTFDQWVYNQAGLPLPFKTASCTSLLNWYKKYDPNRIVKKPKGGDITILQFSKNNLHTGIFESESGNYIYTIEGNTSLSSDDNGGSVMRRKRNKTNVLAYIRPYGEIEHEGDEKMNTVKGSTSNEKKMIKGVQSAAGSVVDGEIGAQTFSDIACIIGAKCFPLTLKIYNAPVIIAEDIVPFAAKGKALRQYKNTINGSFYAGNEPWSILIQDGTVIHKEACHALYGKPESVLYRKINGEFGIKRVISTDELPSEIRWAVGGCGLLANYDPKAEGFCRLTVNGKTENFADVIAKNNHAMIGIKNNHVYLVYCEAMTGSQVHSLAKKLGLEKALMLDGGHVAGINGDESFAKINTATKQQYIIQAITV